MIHFACGLMSALVVGKQRIWSHMTLNVHTEIRCHSTTQTRTEICFFFINLGLMLIH